MYLLYISNLYSHTIKDTIFSKSIDTISYANTGQNLKALDNLDNKFPLNNFKYTTINKPEFSFDKIKNEYIVDDEIYKDRNFASASFKEIESDDKWVASLSNEDISTLPVGIKHDINGVEYSIGIVKAKIGPQHTELTVFARIKLPQTDEKGNPTELFFGANNVKLSHQGGIIGDANLVLLGDIFIPFNGGSWLLSLKGGFNYETGNTENLTYVSIDCDGVKEMSLKGDVQLSRELIIPVDKKGKPLPATKPYKKEDGSTIQIPNRVTGAFNIVASDWNNMIVDINISPFVLSKQPNRFMFSVNKAVFDFSDLRTENVKFPQYYHDNNLLLPNQESWRGIYIQSLEVMLPKEFKTKESIPQKDRVSFKAMDMIIDTYGVSGQFSAEKIIPLESGRTSESKAWAYSVDKIGIEVATNKLIGGSFEGRILLPVSEEVKVNDQSEKSLGLGYKGLISEEEYSLAVSTIDTLNFDVFSAKAELLPNSSVELKVIEGEFRPKAVLNGRMAISASQKKSLADEKLEKNKKKKTVQFKGIEFQNLVLQTISPVISVDYFGYKDEVKLANFPVSIANIAFLSNEHEAGLEFNLMINLMGEKSKGFAADARLGIYGKFKEEQYKQRWKYDRLELSKIGLEANMGAIKLKGSLLLMDDDPIYGDGFSADIEGTFGSFGPITCKTIFGKKEFRYWYVDGAIHGLKIQVGPFQISGFAGGAFYKMTRRPNAGPDFSPSGLSYVPNKDSSLGVKAMVFGAIGDESAIAVAAGFEIEFNKSFGVNRIGLYGEAQVMKAFDFPNPVGKLSEKLSGMVDNELVKGVMDSKHGKTFLDKATEEYEPEIVGKSAISAKMGMEFDFVNESFHATLDLFVDVAGGVIRGRASEGRAGWGVIHISKDEWYVYMGTPTDRLGLKMSIGPLSMETGGYFMIGDNIPGSPPPPPIVANILGVDVESLNYMRDENALGNGRGFAFGHDFSLDTGDLRFLMFYARFQAGGGFDIMLKDYGNAQCANTNDQIGFNGWYANGQGYAYLQGELGIKIKLFFIKKKISIIKGGAAVLLQTKAPNPIWMKGYVGGKYNLLGGLVKGRFRFKLELGEECEFLDESPLGGIKLITDITPKEGANEVDVFAAPQATFSMKINEPIIIPEDDGDKTYKIILERFRMIDENNNEVEGALEWNYMKDRATFVSTDILPPNAKMKVEVEVSFQEKVNGVFKTIMEDGKKAVEFEERSFTTGIAPNEIPLHNVQYSYPVIEQQQFYKDEYKTGYVQLRRGQDYLFNDPNWINKVKIIDSRGNERLITMNYNLSKNKVSYVLPKVQNEEKYLVSIISKPKNSGSSENSETSTKVTNLDDDNSFEVTTKKANNVSKDGDIDRLNYEFKTSKHNTFAKKIKSIKVVDNLWGKIVSDVIYLTSYTNDYEGFDIVELKGSSYTENKPLVLAEAALQDDYFQKDINPIIYQKYLPSSKYTVSRDINELGFRPVRALPLLTYYVTSVEQNVNLGTIATRFPYRYNLPYAYKVDYLDIRDRVFNDYVDGLIASNDRALDILDDEYLFMRKDKYTIKLSYELPGGIKGTSIEYNYKNPIEIR